MKDIVYCHNSSSEKDIVCHLTAMSPHFSLPLEGRVNIDSYAHKLFINAERDEAYDNGILVGLVAYYVNGNNAFVSNVSVLPGYVRNGIGESLLKKMQRHLKTNDVEIVSMEVADDDRLVNFYRKNGFDLGKQLSNDMHQMVQYMYNETPMVSIICLVYNHERYLRDCFEGFIMQRTNFPVEILVHDDASTDCSSEIINEYYTRCPYLFKPICQNINQYSQGLSVSSTYQYPRCKGKYIAVCEGDDYWTDPLKLQKQVDFLENNPEYGLVHTDFGVKIESKNKYYHNGSKYYGYKFSNGDIFYELFQGCFIKTLTVCFRRSLLSHMPVLPNDCFKGDLFLFYELASKSKVQYFDYECGVYRQLQISASHCVDEKSRGKVFDSYRKLDYYYACKCHIPEPIRRNLDKKWYVYDIKHYVKLYDYQKFKLLQNNVLSRKDGMIYFIFKLCMVKPLFYVVAVMVNLKACCQVR